MPNPQKAVNFGHTANRPSGNLRWLPLVWLWIFLSGCATPSFPPVNLASAEWHTETGQAIWKPGVGKPEIVGDVVVAADGRGNAYLQFSKALPIVTARLSPKGWFAEFPPQNRHYSAPGKPPSAIGWLQFLRAYTGLPPGNHWKILQHAEGSISLRNEKTEEAIEAHF